jgi:hypothetical protein
MGSGGGGKIVALNGLGEIRRKISRLVPPFEAVRPRSYVKKVH